MGLHGPYFYQNVEWGMPKYAKVPIGIQNYLWILI